MAQDFAAFNRKIGGVLSEFDGTAARKRLEAIARATAKDVDEAVRGDLGDTSMSGWRRGAPIQITGVAEVQSDSEILVQAAKAGRGPMRVLEQGRNMGNAGGFSGPGVASDGSTKRTKSGGLRKVRARKAKRWNGHTQRGGR